MLNNGDIIFNMPDEKGNIEISIKCHHWLAIGGLQMENEQSTYLKYRVFNAVFLVGIFMSFSCSLMNHLLGMETVVSSVSLACGIVTVGLFITFKISGNYELLSLIVVIFLSFVFSQPCGLSMGDSRQYSILYHYKCWNNCLIAYWIEKMDYIFYFRFSYWCFDGY